MSRKRARVEFEAQGVHLTDVQEEEQNKHGAPVAKKHKGLSRQLKHSNFHLTVNTNKQYNAESYQLVEECKKLQAAADKLINQETLPQFIKFLTPGHSWTPEYIQKVTTTGAVER